MKPIVFKSTEPTESNLMTGKYVRAKDGTKYLIAALSGRACAMDLTHGHRLAKSIRHPGIGKKYSIEDAKAVLGGDWKSFVMDESGEPAVTERSNAKSTDIGIGTIIARSFDGQKTDALYLVAAPVHGKVLLINLATGDRRTEGPIQVLDVYSITEEEFNSMYGLGERKSYFIAEPSDIASFLASSPKFGVDALVKQIEDLKTEIKTQTEVMALVSLVVPKVRLFKHVSDRSRHPILSENYIYRIYQGRLQHNGTCGRWSESNASVKAFLEDVDQGNWVEVERDGKRVINYVLSSQFPLRNSTKDQLRMWRVVDGEKFAESNTAVGGKFTPNFISVSNLKEKLDSGVIKELVI